MAISNQFTLVADWLPSLPAERLDILKRTMPNHTAVTRPVDYFDSIMPSIWLVTDTRQSVRRDVLGIFNWDDQNRTIACTSAKSGLAPTKTYHAFDFWNKAPSPSFRGEFKFDTPAQSCRVIAVRAAEDHPILVSTSRHVTQGIVDVENEQWDNASRIVTGTSSVVGNDPYELRIAGLRDGGHWKPVSVQVSAEDQAAGVAVAIRSVASDGDGWLRVLLSSPASRSVRWSVRWTL
jgi:hypothetical protein